MVISLIVVARTQRHSEPQGKMMSSIYLPLTALPVSTSQLTFERFEGSRKRKGTILKFN